MNYAELLRSPLWQKKRLQILKRDKFSCSICKSQDKTLNVHHKKYIKGRLPWEYPNRAFITHCENCHEMIHMGHMPPEKTWKILDFDVVNIIKLAFRKITGLNQTWMI